MFCGFFPIEYEIAVLVGCIFHATVAWGERMKNDSDRKRAQQRARKKKLKKRRGK